LSYYPRSNRFYSCVALFTFLILAVISQALAQDTCPSYDKKTTAVADTAQWPEGKVVYYVTSDPSVSNPVGLYITSIKKWAPTVIPNTATEKITQVFYTSDGTWLLYHVASGGTRTNPIAGKWIFIKPDGTGKTIVPIGDPVEASLYRNSPYGTEIAYVSDNARTTAKALKVDFSTGSPNFGDTVSRTIVDFSSGLVNISVEAINADQIMGRMNEVHIGTSVSRTTYVTIPDSGRGTAMPDNVYKWKNDIYEDTLYGCGHIFSFDGSLALANAGSMGSACVPNKRQVPPMDHKGFYITPFRHCTDSPITVIENTDVYGISINWCPVEYRLGIWSDVNNGNWVFGNNSDFVVGTVDGPYAPYWGVWIVQWKPNTWNLISPAVKTKKYGRPALFFPDPSAVKQPLRRSGKNSGAAGIKIRQFTNRIVIEAAITGGTVRIVSLNGSVVKSFSKNQRSLVWDFSDNNSRRVPSGIYLINVQNWGSIINQRIMAR
jgi:hypothetical protein